MNKCDKCIHSTVSLTEKPCVECVHSEDLEDKFEEKKKDSWEEFLEWCSDKEWTYMVLKLNDEIKIGLLIEYLKEKIPRERIEHYYDKNNGLISSGAYCYVWKDLTIENLEKIIKEL